ncbi:threonine aldolase family protein [Sulfobacillus harzensis]|uniref:threonine aldolase family protein n=1 Tax=Sulfobacillus harzensis TaxID=2729629 RepID=UPI001FACE186|nr:beta-eliminating lyase-related protein [Sulfobacillus harzensis]
MEIREEGGLKYLHRIESILLADDSRLITLDDVRQLDGQVAALLLELPQREMGGLLPDFETLEGISAWCSDHDIRLHLDGARLYECLPHYHKTASEIADLFDSVYISFYKGIGGVAGAILAGPADFVHEAKVWKRRQGGDLISLYPYIVAADYYFERRIRKMAQYAGWARELASYFNQLPHIHTRPGVPVTNMFHVHVDRPPAIVAPFFQAVTEETGIGFAASLMPAASGSYFEVSLGDAFERVPQDRLEKAFGYLGEMLQTLN